MVACGESENTCSILFSKLTLELAKLFISTSETEFYVKL